MKTRLLTAICVTAAIAVVEGQSEVPYPTGYRDWSHIKSMVIEEGHPLFEAFGGIHHIYANDEAVTGYRDIVKSCGSAISVIRRLPSDPPRCLVPAALRR